MGKSATCSRIFLYFLVLAMLLSFSGTALASPIEEAAKSVVRIAWEFPDREPFRSAFRNPNTGEVELMVSMGSGFMVGDDAGGEFRYAITNWHVVDTTWGRDLDPEWVFEPDEINLYIYRARDDYVPVTVDVPLRSSDVAILEIDPGQRLFGYVPLELGSSDMISRGDDVWAIGYPVDAELLSDLTAAYYTDATVTKGIISRIISFEGVPGFQIDTMISGGNSGGPLVNEHGQVIGINSRGVVRGTDAIPTGINAAVAIDAATDVLRSRDIPFLAAGAAPAAPDPAEAEEDDIIEEIVALAQIDRPQFSSDGVLSWSGINDASGYEITLFKEGEPVASEGAGSGSTRFDFSDTIQGLGAGAYTATVKPLGGGNFEDGPVSAASNIFEQGGGGISPLIIGAGVAAALLVVILVVVFLSMGKKKQAATAPAGVGAGSTPPPAPPKPSLPPVQQSSVTSAAPVTRAKQEAPAAASPVTKAKPSGPKPVLKGVSGNFAGQTIELVEGQLVIGRDPRMAQLVYPQSNEEISRKHCTVRFDERSQKFAVEDSSSNGTFLSSNEKLEPGKSYFLNPGERFYLAEPKEVFEVKME